jgi:hypothetical protein
MSRWDEREERVARRAYAIWESEGRPGGRADEHWELASEEVAAEENTGAALSSVAESMADEPQAEPDDEESLADDESGFPILPEEKRHVGGPRRRGRRKSE